VPVWRRGRATEALFASVCVCFVCAQPLIVQASLVRAGGGKGSGSLIVTGIGAEEGRELVETVRLWVLGYSDQIAGELRVAPFGELGAPPFWTPLQEPRKVRGCGGGCGCGCVREAVDVWWLGPGVCCLQADLHVHFANGYPGMMAHLGPTIALAIVSCLTGRKTRRCALHERSSRVAKGRLGRGGRKPARVGAD
jgi:hypothetical protein